MQIYCVRFYLLEMLVHTNIFWLHSSHQWFYLEIYWNEGPVTVLELFQDKLNTGKPEVGISEKNSIGP